MANLFYVDRRACRRCGNRGLSLAEVWYGQETYTTGASRCISKRIIGRAGVVTISPCERYRCSRHAYKLRRERETAGNRRAGSAFGPIFWAESALLAEHSKPI